MSLYSRNSATQITGYTNNKVSLVLKNVRPHYVLHRDTISSFLYETKDLLSLKNKRDTYIGINISVIPVIFTANFSAFGLDLTPYVTGAFVAGLILIDFQLIKICRKMVQNKDKLSIEGLTNTLAERATSALEYCDENNGNKNS